MDAGVWDKSAKGAHEVRGRKLGIVGYGNIGTQLRVIAESLGMSVYFYDVADKLAIGKRAPLLDVWRSCLSRWRPSRSTWTGGRATTGSSARTSSPG